MNPTELFLNELINSGQLKCTGRLTFNGKVLIDEGETNNALPKELAIKYGFDTDLNEHGARRSAYLDSRLNELRNSTNPVDHTVADHLPKLIVFEDELNNPAQGTPERATLNRNDDMGFAGAMIGRNLMPWQDINGQIVKGHVYLYLGDNDKMAESVMKKFNGMIDSQIEQLRSWASNNSRI